MSVVVKPHMIDAWPISLYLMGIRASRKIIAKDLRSNGAVQMFL